MAIIYKITNEVNDMVYIGVTTSSIEKRWTEHKNSYNRSYRKHRALYGDMCKYGIEKFKIEKIAECNDEERFVKEQYYIDKYNSFVNGYNETKGGTGRKRCNKELIYILHLCDLTPKEISKVTNNHSTAISNILHSIGVSSQAIIDNYNSKRSKSVVMMTLKDEVVKTFDSIVEATIFLNKTRTANNHIRDACKGIRKSAYGYHWKFDS